MNPTTSLMHSRVVAVRAAVAAAVFTLAMGAVGCSEKTEPGPDRGLDFYPVAVGRYWVYAVADSSWSQANQNQPTSTVTVANFQFRETVTEVFSDAAGQPAYRLVRARRPTPTGVWTNDSVYTLSPSVHSVILNRDNRRTLELIFPVQDGKLWNFNAFNNNTNDTVTAETRRYRNVGQPFTTRTGSVSQTYSSTLTTTNEGTAKAEDLYYVRTYRQVFAKGIGPVLRQRRRFDNFYLPSGQTVTFYPHAYFFGFSRTETLVEYGPR